MVVGTGGVDHIHIAGAVDGQSARMINPCRCPHAMVRIRLAGLASQRVHHAIGRDLAHGLVVTVGATDIAIAVCGDAVGTIETRRCQRPSVGLAMAVA